MLKSFTQQRIELREGRDLKILLLEALEQYRGTGGDLVYHLALHFHVSDGSIRNWCRSLEIDINLYKESPTDSNKAKS